MVGFFDFTSHHDWAVSVAKKDVHSVVPQCIIMTTCYRILLLLSGFQVDEVHILKLSLTGLIFSISKGELLIKGHWCSIESWYFHLECHVSSTKQRSYRCHVISDMKMASASCKMGLNQTAFYPLPPTHRLTWTLQINYTSPRHCPPYN